MKLPVPEPTKGALYDDKLQRTAIHGEGGRMDLLAELRERISVIRHHWWTFALSIALGAVLAFMAASTLYEARIGTVEAANEYLRDRLEGGQAGPTPEAVTGAYLPWAAIGGWALLGVIVLGVISLGWSAVRAVRQRRVAKVGLSVLHLAPAPSPAPPSSAIQGGGGAGGTLPVHTSDPLSFLKAGPGWSKARNPHVEIKDVRSDITGGGHKAKQIRAEIELINRTASELTKCSILVQSIATNGQLLPGSVYVMRGREPRHQWSILAQGTAKAIVAFRNYEVAPDEAFRLNAMTTGLNALQVQPNPITLADNQTHRLNLIVDSGAGVVTRAIIQLVIGEYEELEVTLLGQASWRQSP